jgi:hypothetical protein
MMQQLLGGRIYPLTLEGLDKAGTGADRKPSLCVIPVWHFDAIHQDRS